MNNFTQEEIDILLGFINNVEVNSLEEAEIYISIKKKLLNPIVNVPVKKFKIGELENGDIIPVKTDKPFQPIKKKEEETPIDLKNVDMEDPMMAKIMNYAQKTKEPSKIESLGVIIEEIHPTK